MRARFPVHPDMFGIFKKSNDRLKINDFLSNKYVCFIKAQYSKIFVNIIYITRLEMKVD